MSKRLWWISLFDKEERLVSEDFIMVDYTKVIEQFKQAAWDWIKTYGEVL